MHLRSACSSGFRSSSSRTSRRRARSTITKSPSMRMACLAVYNSPGWLDRPPLGFPMNTNSAGGLIEVQISAIEHFSYCARQCALIHVEQVFEENVFTIRGRLAHERVEAGEEALSFGVRIVRAVPLWSERLGLRGVAD